MAQRPPRMPRRPAAQHSQAGPSQPGRHAPGGSHEASRGLPGHSGKVVKLPVEDAATSASEPATDALHVVPAARPKQVAARPARTASNTSPTSAAKTGTGRRSKPEPAAEPAPARPARFEKAKQKQSQRRRVDRVKFSAAVRRKPGEPAPARPDEPDQEPVAAHRFSGRVAALLVVLAFFAVMLVPTVNHYRNQMHEINDLRASIAQLEAEQGRLQEEIARWDDPLYIKQQARDRINLVMPGERVYMVVGEQPADDADELHNASTYEVRQELPWVDALLDSMRRAGTD